MGLESLLGNEDLKRRLTAAIRAGKTAHSYLIVGPEGSGKRTLSRLLCAALQCESTEGAPCLTCRQCRKVLSGVHPDVVTLGDPKKKTIPVSEARTVAADLYVRPTEGKKKIYVFPPTHTLGRETQNALLKSIEEPPEYGVFLFLTAQKELLLPTVRSRCAEWVLTPVPRGEAIRHLAGLLPKASASELENAYERSGGYLGAALTLLRGKGDERALELAEAYAAHDRCRLAVQFFKLEKTERESFLSVLDALRALLAEGLSAKYGASPSETGEKLCRNRTAAELLAACRAVGTACERARANVGVGHLCGWLTVTLR